MLLEEHRNSGDTSDSRRSPADVANGQETVIGDTRNGISDLASRYLRATEIIGDYLPRRASESERHVVEDLSERSYEEVSYESTSGIYVEVEDGEAITTAGDDADVRNIKLFKNQSYGPPSFPPQRVFPPPK